MNKSNNVLMGVLAYLGPLVIIPYLTTKDDPFVKFHIKQGLVLFVIELLVWVLTMSLWSLGPLLSLINLGTLILVIVGIVNVARHQEKDLPLVGQFAKNFKI